MSRQFIKQTETGLAELPARDPTAEDIKGLMLDGEHMTGRCASPFGLAVTAVGEKFPGGLWDGARSALVHRSGRAAAVFGLVHVAVGVSYCGAEAALGVAGGYADRSRDAGGGQQVA